jgi:hypothetical protein
MDVLFANPHSEADLATLTVSMRGGSAEWVRPVRLGLRMPDIGERVDCLGYDLVTAEGDLDADDVERILERNLSISIGRVIEQQPQRRLNGVHRTSPGFRTTAATPSGMSGGPAFDKNNEVIGFNSGSTGPNENDPVGLVRFRGRGRAGVELPRPPADQDDDQADMGIETRAIHFVQLVASGEVACEMHPSSGVDPETGMAGYVIPPTLGGDEPTSPMQGKTTQESPGSPAIREVRHIRA